MKKRTLLFLLLSFALVFWGTGFLSYIQTVRQYRQPAIDETLSKTPAIVVLTGGSERVQAGIDLLKAQKGDKLLISGVHARVRPEEISPIKTLPQPLQECCLVLGHEATDTRGNAEETATFMRDQKLKTLRLVTANYHMPRSLLLLKTAMPDVEILPFPVQPDIVRLDAWWRTPGTLSLLVFEYNKYLFVSLSALFGLPL